VRARPAPDDLSLLPARYHVFARALEGAFACLNVALHSKPDQDLQPETRNLKLETRMERLFLTRRETCPHCQSRVFELATCPRCGAAYLVGRLVRDREQDLVHLHHLY